MFSFMNRPQSLKIRFMRFGPNVWYSGIVHSGHRFHRVYFLWNNTAYRPLSINRTTRLNNNLLVSISETPMQHKFPFIFDELESCFTAFDSPLYVCIHIYLKYMSLILILQCTERTHFLMIISPLLTSMSLGPIVYVS